MTVVTQRVVRLVVLLLGVLVMALGALSATESARAHDGPYELAVSSNGAGGLTVSVTFTEDNHPVEELINPVATATSAAGETVGPVSLILSTEGQAFWITAEPFIPIGDWSVTVSTKGPDAATTTVDITVAELAGPAEVEETAEADSGFALAPVLWIVVIVVVLAAVAGSVLLSRRRLVTHKSIPEKVR